MVDTIDPHESEGRNSEEDEQLELLGGETVISSLQEKVKQRLEGIMRNSAKEYTEAERALVVRSFVELRMVDTRASAFIATHKGITSGTVINWNKRNELKQAHASANEFAEIRLLERKLDAEIPPVQDDEKKRNLSPFRIPILRYKLLCRLVGLDDEWESFSKKHHLGQTVAWARHLGNPTTPLFSQDEILAEIESQRETKEPQIRRMNSTSMIPSLDIKVPPEFSTEVDMKDEGDALIITIGNARKLLMQDEILAELVGIAMPLVEGPNLRMILKEEQMDKAAIEAITDLVQQEIRLLEYFLSEAYPDELTPQLFVQLADKIGHDIYNGRRVWRYNGLLKMIERFAVSSKYNMLERAGVQWDKRKFMERAIIEREVNTKAMSKEEANEIPEFKRRGWIDLTKPLSDEEIAETIRRDLYIGKHVPDYYGLLETIDLYRREKSWSDRYDSKDDE